jgi:hypothetical protein
VKIFGFLENIEAKEVSCGTETVVGWGESENFNAF